MSKRQKSILEHILDKLVADDPEISNLRQHYREQLPMIAALMIPDDDYDPIEIAEEAFALIAACLAVVEGRGHAS